MLSDAQIAREAKLQKIQIIANKLGYSDDDVECFGHFKAKVKADLSAQKGKLILVTAMNPTPLGEGKTTIAIGLADALNRIGKKATLALREPSLGPVFGIKGGACGGGFSQVVPMEEINLHFTGDFHAITTANNLLSALIDNHIHQGNRLKISEVIWRRCLDMNDRALREVEVALGGKSNGVPRKDGFTITAASEIMAILCLSTSLGDLKRRLGNIVVGYSADGNEVCARDLHAEEAMTVLLKEAINPNLVQTLEGTPALIHGGPFANIAHGCNSILATKTALARSEYVVTEAGFGAELGAEKFFDIKCRIAELRPSCVVLVVTARSIKYNAGIEKTATSNENLEALKTGFANIARHLANLNKFGQKVVVAINRFPADTDAEIALIGELASEYNANAVVTTNFVDGGRGAEKLAQEVVKLAMLSDKNINFSYPLGASIADKIAAVAVNIYGAKCVTYSPLAEEHLAKIKANEKYANFPVCIAKTQYSFSCDEKLLGAPTNFEFEVQDIIPRAGAGFLVVVGGKILLMPGLSASPNTERITINTETGVVDGLM
ncbi:MAG: formate--tetrahydrofolate ligase [Clostridia bacterium]